jgi:tetratricopeptide (TPR) repeat protein
MNRGRALQRFYALFPGMMLAACTVQSSTSNHYLTAEKLWTEKNYPAAVAEFDHVVKEAPNSAIGLQALWRASMTRTLFLDESDEALKGFETFIERAGSSELAPQAEQEMGEIYFSKLNQYAKAIPFYQKLLDSHKFSPDDEAKFTYRIARSHFLSNRLKPAIDGYEKLRAFYPKSPLYDKAQFDLANAWYAVGDSDKLAYPKALKLFQDLAQKTMLRNHALYVESIFGEASTLEEMDQFDEAYELLQKIENDYPAPNVIKIRMLSIEDRKKKKRK